MEFPKFYSVGLKNSLMLQMNPLSYGFVNEMLFPEIIEQKNILLEIPFGAQKKLLMKILLAAEYIYLNVTVP